MEYLYEKLTAYGNSDYYAFHMPGHKRNMELMRARLPYNIDITEIDGFDDLHHAEGLLKELQENAARVFQAEETHYLVNGSTVGLLSAVMGCTERGGRILMARNCHKSVYNAVYINELRPVYIYPEFSEETDLNGEIHVDQIKKLLEEYEDIQAVVIVSPTYEGVVSDIEAIAEIVHEYKIPLIVDEAHGAHFGFHSYFPQNANTRGADVVIHSLHKTLPSLTQTALLHINGRYADRERIRNYLHMLQSSSPSYILMASIDECVRAMDERREEIMDTYVERLQHTRERLKQLKNIKLIETKDAAAAHAKLKPIHDTFIKKNFKLTKDAYAAQHKEELDTFNKAVRTLMKLNGSTAVDFSALDAEFSALQSGSAELRTKLETLQPDVSALKNIRKYIDMVLNKQQLSTPGGKPPEKESVLKQLEQLQQKKSNHKTISTTPNREESL